VSLVLMKFISVAFIGIGGSWLVVSLFDLRRAVASRKWPTVEAEVVHSELKVSGRSKRWYTPAILYQYQHQGSSYQGKTFVFSGGFLNTRSHEDAQRFIAPFQPGVRLAVHICPSNPRLSVIEPGIGGHLWVGLVFLLAFLAAGIKAWAGPS